MRQDKVTFGVFVIGSYLVQRNEFLSSVKISEQRAVRIKLVTD